MTSDEKLPVVPSSEDFQNVFAVAKTDHGVCIVKPPTVSITKVQAANLAAWLLVMAGPEVAMVFPAFLSCAAELSGLIPGPKDPGGD